VIDSDAGICQNSSSRRPNIEVMNCGINRRKNAIATHIHTSISDLPHDFILTLGSSSALTKAAVSSVQGYLPWHSSPHITNNGHVRNQAECTHAQTQQRTSQQAAAGCIPELTGTARYRGCWGLQAVAGQSGKSVLTGFDLSLKVNTHRHCPIIR